MTVTNASRVYTVTATEPLTSDPYGDPEDALLEPGGGSENLGIHTTLDGAKKQAKHHLDDHVKTEEIPSSNVKSRTSHNILAGEQLSEMSLVRRKCSRWRSQQSH
jgi:hypothetical protein